MWDEGRKDRGARDPPVSVLLLFDPKAPNARTAAGLLTRFGRHAFPSEGDSGTRECAAFVETYSYGDSS